MTLAVFGGLVTIIAVMVTQMAMDHGKERRQLHRAAGTLGIEVAAIAEAIESRDLARPGIPGIYKMRPIPKGAYDGVVSSGVLSKFDLQAQELLYRFYWRASIGDYKGIESMIDQVADTIERVARKNAPGLRAALGMATRHALDGRAGGGEAAPGGTVRGMHGPGGGGVSGSREAESVGAPIRGYGL